MTFNLNRCLHRFFHVYLQEQRTLSAHTIKSYRDTFSLLIGYIRSRRRTSPQLSILNLDVKIILAFLQHLEKERANSAQTRNQRLAAIQCFFKYVSLHHPALERHAKRILAVPMKRIPHKSADSLNRQELEALLAQPPIASSDGIRDLAILTFLYNTGARASEAAEARLSWFDFPNRMVTITGKGDKTRQTPLWPSTVQLLKLYKDRHRRRPRNDASAYFFVNQRNGAFTRFGIRDIVKKYLRQAAKKCSSLNGKNLSTHSLRHTTAVHLLEARVEPNVIKAWLGHASINSTDRYLDTDLGTKRRILERFGPPPYVTSSLEPQQQGSSDQILEWLKDL